MKAFFFDRDGTLNIDTGYINDPRDMLLYENVSDVLKEIKSHTYRIFVISNQSGIGRGLIKPYEYRNVNDKFISLIGNNIIDEILYCPHVPANECDCRKPKSLLVEIVHEHYNINPSESYFVGDKLSDVLCGKNLGFKTVLIADKSESDKLGFVDEVKPDAVIYSISELIQVLDI